MGNFSDPLQHLRSFSEFCRCVTTPAAYCVVLPEELLSARKLGWFLGLHCPVKVFKAAWWTFQGGTDLQNKQISEVYAQVLLTSRLPDHPFARWYIKYITEMLNSKTLNLPYRKKKIEKMVNLCNPAVGSVYLYMILCKER